MLTFDWDEVTVGDSRVQEALACLIEEFGNYQVHVRVSSSGEGLHVVIAERTYDHDNGKSHLIPHPLEPEQSQQWRIKFAEEPWLLECKGRLESDRPRAQVGLAIGRLFGNKNGALSGPWMLATQCLQEQEVISEVIGEPHG